MSAISLYFKAILSGVQSTRNGMALTWKHAWSARKSRKIQQIQDPQYFNASENTGILPWNIRIKKYRFRSMEDTSCTMRWTIASFAINVSKYVPWIALKLTLLKRRALLDIPQMDPLFDYMQQNLTSICQNVVSVVYVPQFAQRNV